MRDAEASAEAVTRPTRRFVPVKEVAHQDIQALHRIRERLLGARTALVHAGHGLLHEYGMVMPKGLAKFRQTVMAKLEADKDKLTALSQERFGKLLKELAALEEQRAYYQEKLDTLAKTHPEWQRLMTIPGMGAITATALIAAVSDGGCAKMAARLPPGDSQLAGFQSTAKPPL
jgi:transposase